MENLDQQKTKTRREEVADAILRSPEEIEEEFQRTANSWLACFGSRVFIVETLLFGQKVENELGEEQYREVQKKLEALKQKLYSLKEKYPEKSTVPPDTTKQELLNMLDVLK